LVMSTVPARLQPAGEPPWPALEALGGELIFERAGMRVQGASARVRGQPQWRFAKIRAEIADFNRPRVLVQGEGSGPLAAALAIVRQSPLAAMTRHALDDMSATGDAGLELKLELPLEALERARVQGRVRLQGNDLQLAAAAPPLTQARGAVSFSENGFAIEEGRAQALGGSARISGGSVAGAAADAPAVQVRASGGANVEELRAMAGRGQAWNLVATLARQGSSGSVNYEAVVGFRGAAASVSVASDLRGLALALPAPLDKPRDAAWPLRFEIGPRASATGSSAPARERLLLRVGERLALDYELAPGTPARVLRGAIAIGPAVTSALVLPASGVQARLQWPELDLDAWERALRPLTAATAPGKGAAPAGAGSSGYLPSAVSIQVETLRWDERTLHDVTAAGVREGSLWRTQIQSRELAGRVEYTEGSAERAGAVHARLVRLVIPASEAGESALEQPPSRIPALDVVVDEFELRGKKLGRLELQAVNRDMAAASGAATQEWQLDRLALTTPEASLAATGRWAGAARSSGAGEARRRTALDFKLNIRDAGALLARFGMPGVLRGGKGQIEGKLGWAGSPFSPHYASMDGKLHLDMGAGQFLKADPGLAKLLGVLSLQALPRRLTLDFRDVFSAGFAFDFVRGDAQVERGVLATSNLQMKGVNAAVLMDGKVDLERQTQDLRVVVVPEFDAGTVALATALINPVIGLSAFLAQLVLKQPLIRAATREFHVTGRWDNPEVAPVKVSAPKDKESQ
ncbi:MAG: TIGR02099 family protein, partial [Burkholderiales bacterium]|nr:TIGR02099 family protein [Burkholderiales bacterium]